MHLNSGGGAFSSGGAQPRPPRSLHLHGGSGGVSGAPHQNYLYKNHLCLFWILVLFNVGITFGVGTRIGMCVGAGAGIGLGIGSISQHLASGSI